MHSLIISNRNYNRYLGHCLWSIERSARQCGIKDWEVVVVDDSSETAPAIPFRGVVYTVPRKSELFNKPRLLNFGIEQARGDVLTFLDADAIVGRRFMESVDRLHRQGAMALTKLCYRVRYLKKIAIEELDDTADREGLVDGWFARYDSFPRAFEGYGWQAQDGWGYDEPGIDLDDTVWFDSKMGRRLRGKTRGEPVFGNSQFSILRSTLGELEFNEDYVGRGFEDLWMNREIFRRHGKDYRAAIVTDPDHTMFHVSNPPLKGWGPGEENDANFRRYHST